MANVFSTNVNVFTAADVTALQHRVVSWAWRDPSQPVDRQRAAMLDETRQALHRFPHAAELAHAYHSYKVILPGDRWRALWAAMAWTVTAVHAADRVLVAAPPGGADRILWAVACVSARLMRRPIYAYSEVWIEPTGRRHWPARWLQQRLRKVAHRTLVPGHIHREYQIAAGVEPERIVVIDSIYCPRTHSTSLLPVHADGPSDGFTLLYVGRLVPLKGLERLLRMMTRMQQRNAGLRLTVVAARIEQYMGSDAGYADRCRRLLGSLPVERVTLVEHLDDIERVYERADALVMPNVIIPQDKVPAEAWGRVVEEALWHGLPVVSTDAVPAALESVVEGVTGHIVPWDCDEALESALETLVSGR